MAGINVYVINPFGPRVRTHRARELARSILPFPFSPAPFFQNDCHAYYWYLLVLEQYYPMFGEELTVLIWLKMIFQESVEVKVPFQIAIRV